MKYLLPILILTVSVTHAQKSQSNHLINTCDSLLLDSKYERVIQLVDGFTGSDQRTNIFLQNKKAEALTRLGKFNEAGDLVTSLKEQTKNDQGIFKALTLYNSALLDMNKGRNDLAIENFNESMRYFEAAGETNSLDGAQTLAQLAIALKAMGNVSEAEARLQLALSYRKDKLPETHELIAASYNDLGFVYAGTDDDKALEYYEKALEIYQKIHGNEHPKIAIVNNNIGFINRKMEFYGDAVNNFDAALKIWDKVYPQAHPAKAFTLQNLGLTYARMGDQKAALGYYERALDIYKKSYGEKHPDLASVYNVIGNIKNSQEDFDQALAYYQKAMIANISNFEESDVSVNPGTKRYYNGNVLLYSMMYKAQALENKYLIKTLKKTSLDLALQTLQSCDTLIDRLRQQITNESDKIALGAIANEVYGDGVRITSLLAQVSWKKENYKELAFYFAEKSKSAVLLDAISDTDAKSFAKIPAETLEEEKNLKTSIALINQKLAQKPSPEEEKYLRESAFLLNTNYQDFVKKLEKDYPEYFNLKFNAASPSIKQLQQLLDQHTALLSYFIDEKSSRLYTFLITKKKYKLFSSGFGKEFDLYLTGFRNSLYYMEMRSYTKTATYLSKLLLPKQVGKEITDLVILPTGRLGVIPFEALLTGKMKDSKAGFESLPYLVKKFSVRYEFSAGLVLQKTHNEPESKISSAMLCAPITFPKKFNLVDLPGTESEVKTISNLFSEKHIQSNMYLNDAANESSVKHAGLKDYNIIHFATHGIVDENHPELSRIFLQSNSESEDGNLYTSEIYNLELNANLVTLSACQTGLGKISKGEGVIGLSRALVYAGADRIIVSFWSVADESTATLMTNFYRLLLEKQTNDYGGELRKAKLDLIHSKYAAPYYWAPFILIGF